MQAPQDGNTGLCINEGCAWHLPKADRLEQTPMKNTPDVQQAPPSRSWAGWKHNLRLRVTVVLSLLLGAIIVIAAGVRISEMSHTLERSAHPRALAISRTFTIIGSAAIVDNLYRIQEALGSYRDDQDLRLVDILDPDWMIIASTDSRRISSILHDPYLGQAQTSGTEVITHGRAQDDTPLLIAVEPLRDHAEIAAWARIEFSLTGMNQEITRAIHESILTTILLIGAGVLIFQLSIHRIITLFRHTAEQLQVTLDALSHRGRYHLVPSCKAPSPSP